MLSCGARLHCKPIEKLDCGDSKLQLPLQECTDYGPTTTRLALKLWQTKGGI